MISRPFALLLVVLHASAAAASPGDVALEHLSAHGEDLSSVVVREVHHGRNGATVVRLGQTVGGVDVFRQSVRVVMDGSGKLVALSGHVAPHGPDDAHPKRFRVDPQEAIALAFQELTGVPVPAAAFVAGKPVNAWTPYGHATGLAAGFEPRLLAPARGRRVLYPAADGLVAAYQVELYVGRDGAQDAAYRSLVVSAVDGRVLFHHDLSAAAEYGYRVWANAWPPYTPHDGPQGPDATPHPTGNPDGSVAPFVPQALITLQNAPFSRNDPWLPANATRTSGNNVDAYLELGAPVGFQPGVDLYAEATPGGFDYTYDPTRSPSVSADQRMSAVTQLFFVTNFLHDWFYDAGFDEAAGNAQLLNHGRGGVDGDRLRAVAQDYSSNVPFRSFVPADGASPVLSFSTSLGRDVAVDASVVAHEWGHLLTSRLVGDANGLANSQGRALAEGWSDFVSLLLIVREEDRNRPGNDRFQGTYSVGGYVAGAASADGSYFGLRRVPYSTDFNRNALTFAHVRNGVSLPANHPLAPRSVATTNALPHHAGEVWATMLWECYASLLNAYPFQEAQDRMKQYLVAGLKATPVDPTFLEARDALLAAASASDPADYQRFLNAFAKRGAGVGAQAPARDSLDHVGVVESRIQGNNLQVVRTSLDDSDSGCDRDGILDVGETGRLAVTVRNTGNALGFFTATVTASGATASVAFPSGNTLGFPSLARGQSATRTLQVRLNNVTGSDPRAGFTITFDEPSLPTAARTVTFNPQVHRDEAARVSASDDMEATASAWTAGRADGASSWERTSEAGNHFQHAASPADTTARILVGPWMTVNAAGDVALSFRHRHSFARDAHGADFGAGTLEATTDGETWSALQGFTGMSAAFPAWTTTTVNLGTRFAGRAVRVRFRLQPSVEGSAYGWDVDDVVAGNLAHTPFAARVLETSTGSTCNVVPVADAGPDLEVREFVANGQGGLQRSTVTLSGLGSLDVEGAPLTYAWTQRAGPPVTLWNAETASPTFVADVPATTTLSFELVVHDGVNASLPAEVNVRVVDVNRAPNAAATAPASAPERGGAISLDGTASSDPDGNTLSFAWTQIGGPAVDLVNADTATPTFAPPEVPNDTTVTFQLVVNDGTADGAPAQVSVTVQHVDRLPVVELPGPLSADARSLVELAVTATDPDGDAVTFSWAQTGGPAVELSGSDTARVLFLAPDVRLETTVTLALTVTAAGNPTLFTVPVTILPVNRHPVGETPLQLAEDERTQLTLVSEGGDPDGDALTYRWRQTGGPLVALDGDETSALTFVTPEVLVDTWLTFELIVSDGVLASVPVVVTVVVRNVDRAPSVATDEAVDAEARARVRLIASATDPDGDVVTFAWVQVDGEPVTLEDADTALPAFTAPDVRADTVLRFAVTATAGALSAEAQVEVTVHPANRPPVVGAGTTHTADERTQVVLSAPGASDPDEDTLAYAWTQVGGPLVTLAGADTAEVSFTAPEVSVDTVVTLAVVVRDASGESAPAFHSVTVVNVDPPPSPPPAEEPAEDGGCASTGTSVLALLSLVSFLRRRTGHRRA